jgi:hypothetical protein
MLDTNHNSYHMTEHGRSYINIQYVSIELGQAPVVVSVAVSSKGSVVDYTGVATPASNDLSPISQTSPISMSPLSPGVSPQNSEVNSPIAGTIGKEVRMKIHSRRFRE